MPASLQELAARVQDKLSVIASQTDGCAGHVRELCEAVQAALQPMGEMPRYGPQFDADDPQIFNGMGQESMGEWIRAADAERAILQAREKTNV